MTPTRIVPLAERLRPQKMSEMLGQQHLLAVGKPLYQWPQQPHSMILAGTAGIGKTTLARLCAAALDMPWCALSAVLDGVKALRAAVNDAVSAGQSLLVFIDEIHRFNRTQQDALLPYLEDGRVILIGATTENPSFAVTRALLSRCRVYALQPLCEADLAQLLGRAVQVLTPALVLSSAAQAQLLTWADGDARRLLNDLEQVATLSNGKPVTEMELVQWFSHQSRQFDRQGDVFYDQISALHKAIRGSDPDAALYWLARLLDGGADPYYIARRLLRIASEDVGLADPRALSHTVAAVEAFTRLGTTEGHLALAQAAMYLAVAPKSNALYRAFDAASAWVARDTSRAVPLHLRNAPTALARQAGHGRDYRYPHDEPHAYAAGEDYWPAGMPKPTWYQPTPRGLEAKIAAKLAQLRALDATVQQTPVQSHSPQAHRFQEKY